ncbi:Clan CA, family C19, ubiquitin hydrolase-like cysteine peptidase [Trichomonas vaginalis G3]|uniref:Clan CA, family C19, ubiquitin hydrolase-like cysteine peptidase n=1 Tax=Trichomonas vaginalis (strain ATCC PRA-98 / G3) TaxID=412133 RepID=A2FYY6_TRIV3|nr:ubiquitinyl hydrolase protein [Trichomonas vaginalis G3]EAX89887.1 Clan CA, family C19, ubiquitin hydrolase-like cysteine peptidase [Trichomonas vaginalis G3]KAI5518463.1 ubiquitinyl hydrolase protein [Trichomonas vaginalis G3]|eukprot:XP_001302817.1 Clan CA, family C19, ubiquitin hydrolase-like cysteine peptidase [Trichomonas vaginalis G3]
MEQILSGGIINLSNTCYLSVSLQILFRFKPLAKLIQSYAELYPEKQIFKIFSTLQHNFVTQTTPLSPEPLTTALKIDKSKQQDMSEFLSYFLNYLLESLPKDKQSTLLELINCKLYDSLGNQRDNVFIYTIPVDSKYTVDEALRSSLDSNKYRFSHPPKLFFLQLHRLCFNKLTKTEYKRFDPMNIPTMIDLTPYGACIYHLLGVVQHIGTSVYGHYRIGLQDSQGWMIANDKYVRTSTLEEILTSSISNVSPAYVLAFVSDINDIVTMRDVIEVRASELPELPRPVGSRIGEIKCAFNFPKSDNREVKSDSGGIDDQFPLKNKDTSYEVITQSFKQSTMEFDNPDKMLFETVDEIKSLVNEFKEDTQTSMVFGYDKPYLESEFPEDFGKYELPLYIMMQQSGYRKFLRNPVENDKLVHVIFCVEFTPFTFSSVFYSFQKFEKVVEYANKYMKEIFESRDDYKVLLSYYGFLARSDKKYRLSDLYPKERKSLILHVLPERMPVSKPKSTVPIKIYKVSNPCDIYKTADFIVRVNPKVKHLLKSFDLVGENCRVFRVNSEAICEELHGRIRPDLLYMKGNDIRIIIGATDTLTLFSVYFDGSFIQNFFFNAPESFESLKISLTNFIQMRNFSVTFHSIGKQEVVEGNPAELVRQSAGKVSYFSVQNE